ncbi:hypothetical protein FF098_015820 [Parvularcula flava]|uniref:Uncharacterized protein n=1 Tax=Aquisalinus luteolus TaxID=1566827 RepID=A0A8J3ERV6_9PROT|nr:hypothetical protein [Aquisalinus luteolus]NHK29383.1 hypothetical protein [Aquisalinus luteolus]GGI00939.1 hypothetical protein GCM10011355_30400 [Aquisalinus luteolus]
MAYNRKTSKLVLGLKALAWTCDNWFWPALVLILLAPASPHILIGDGYGTCAYAGRLGTVTASPIKASCPMIRIFSVY